MFSTLVDIFNKNNKPQYQQSSSSGQPDPGSGPGGMRAAKDAARAKLAPPPPPPNPMFAGLMPQGAAIATPSGPVGQPITKTSGFNTSPPQTFAEVAQRQKAKANQQAGVEAGAEAQGFQSDANKTWADMLSSSNQMQNDALRSTYADEAQNERRAAEANAMGGGAIGGGFAAGQAQAQLGGTQQRLDVRQKFAGQQLNMKAAYLQTLIKQAEASKDRNLQRELQAELDKTNLQINQSQVNQQAQDTQTQAGISQTQADAQKYAADHGIINDLTGGLTSFF